MKELDTFLSGGDLRSIGKSNAIVKEIKNQKEFDALFKFLFYPDRLVVMRAADAIEKITIHHPQYLIGHESEIFSLCNSVKNKELKWHLALLAPRLLLSTKDFGLIWDILTNWAKDKTNSRIVRANAIQGLAVMVTRQKDLEKELTWLLTALEKENIPSLNAKIRKVKNAGFRK